MRTIALSLIVVGLAVLTGCSSSSSSNMTPTPDTGTTAGAATDASAAATGAQSTPAAGSVTVVPDITVLPNGVAVDASDAPLPQAESTQAAEGLAGGGNGPVSDGSAAGGPPANPTTSAVAVDTPASPPTEAPLCVERPTPGCSTPPPVSTAIVPDAQGIVIDADPSTPTVDTNAINAAAGQTFSIGVDIATAPQPYEGYEWDLVIDGPISFVRSDQVKPANLTLCSTTTHVGAETANEYYGGCLSTDKNVSYTGPVDTVTLRCTGPGAGQLHLRKQNAGSPFGTDLLNSNAEPITGEVGPSITVACA